MEKVQSPNRALVAALAVAGLVLDRTGLLRAGHGARDMTRLSGVRPLGGLGNLGHAEEAGAPASDRLHGPKDPAALPRRDAWKVMKGTVGRFMQDRIMAEAAAVTFYAMLALFPALASMISLYGLVADPSKLYEQLQGLGGVVPAGGIDIISAQVKALTSSGAQALGFGFVVGLATSLWSANAGVKAFFDAMNVVCHERERRSFLRLTMISFCFTLGMIALVVLSMISVVVIPVVLAYVGFGSSGAVLLSVARWPVMLVAVALTLSLLYRFGPSRRDVHWRWVSWGSAAASVGWILVSLAFSYYVANFGSYNKTYGSLGAAMGFMTWIWVSVMVVLLGAELNAELEPQGSAGERKPGLGL